MSEKAVWEAIFMDSTAVANKAYKYHVLGLSQNYKNLVSQIYCANNSSTFEPSSQ